MSTYHTALNVLKV